MRPKKERSKFREKTGTTSRSRPSVITSFDNIEWNRIDSPIALAPYSLPGPREPAPIVWKLCPGRPPLAQKRQRGKQFWEVLIRFLSGIGSGFKF